MSWFGLIALLFFAMFFWRLYVLLFPPIGLKKVVTKDGIEFWYQQKENRVYIAVKSSIPVPFCVRLRTNEDLPVLDQPTTTNVETGDKDFDERLFVECDWSKFIDVLKQNHVLRKKLMDLLQGPEMALFERGNFLYLEIEGQRLYETRPDSEIVSRLNQIMELLEGLKEASLRDRLQFWAVIAAAFEALCFSILGTGLYLAYENIPTESNQDFESSGVFQILKISLPFAAGISAGLFIIAALLTRVTAKAYAMRRRISGAIIVGAPFFCYFFTNSLNAQLDNSPAVYREVTVNLKSITTHGRGNEKYSFIAEDWQFPSKQRKYRTDRSFYTDITEGQKIWVITKPGYFGRKWFVGLALKR